MTKYILPEDKNYIFKDSDKKFDSIMASMKRSCQIYGIDKFYDAYNMAKYFHGNTKRESGELYIYHPMAVFEKMYKDGFVDTDALAAALLHDTVEDTELTLDQIEEEFGPMVRKHVEGVTKFKESPENGISTNMAQFFTDEHLIEVANKYQYAAYIKFADRWHNLTNSSAMSQKSISSNVNHTKSILVPLARRLGCNAMAEELLDACYYAQHTDEYNSISTQMHTFAKESSIAAFNSTLNSIKNVLAKGGNAELYEKNHSVFMELPLPYSIAESMLRTNPNANLKRKDSLSFYQFKPYYIVYMLFTKKQKNYHQAFLAQCFELIKNGCISLWDEQYDDNIQNTEVEYVDIRDSYFNRIRIVLCSEENFWQYRNAIAASDNGHLTYASVLPKEKRIKVYTKDGAEFDIEKDATVLDFAFMLHKEIGMHYCGATVNGEQKEMDYLLQNGDQIVVFTAPEVTANLLWFNILQTKPATKRLVDILKNT